MSERKYITPIYGNLYENKNGAVYRCVSVCYDGDHSAMMRRIKDGWTILCHGIQQYPDGKIEWNYSTGGHWHRRT